MVTHIISITNLLLSDISATCMRTSLLGDLKWTLCLAGIYRVCVTGRCNPRGSSSTGVRRLSPIINTLINLNNDTLTDQSCY